MAIHRVRIGETPDKGSFGLKKNVMRCWGCGKVSPALVISPSSGNPLCEQCAGGHWSGVKVVERAKTPKAD